MSGSSPRGQELSPSPHTPGQERKVPPNLTIYPASRTTDLPPCLFCKRCENHQEKYGQLITDKDSGITVHYFCLNKSEEHLLPSAGVHSFSIDLPTEQVVVETTLPSAKVQELLESTGRRAVIKGMGQAHLGAAVSQMSGFGRSAVQGVVRFVQLSEKKVAIEGTIDGLTPGLHGLAVHELGDLSQGCDSCGDHFNPTNSCHGGPGDQERHVGDLGNVLADERGRAEFRMEDERLKVWDIIGRSLVVHSGKDDLGKGKDASSKQDGSAGPGLACGIVARSASLFQNPKKICTCDGVSLWDERDVPLAGPGRRQQCSL